MKPEVKTYTSFVVDIYDTHDKLVDTWEPEDYEIEGTVTPQAAIEMYTRTMQVCRETLKNLSVNYGTKLQSLWIYLHLQNRAVVPIVTEYHDTLRLTYIIDFDDITPMYDILKFYEP